MPNIEFMSRRLSKAYISDSGGDVRLHCFHPFRHISLTAVEMEAVTYLISLRIADHGHIHNQVVMVKNIRHSHKHLFQWRLVDAQALHLCCARSSPSPAR